MPGWMRGSWGYGRGPGPWYGGRGFGGPCAHPGWWYYPPYPPEGYPGAPGYGPPPDAEKAFLEDQLRFLEQEVAGIQAEMDAIRNRIKELRQEAE